MPPYRPSQFPNVMCWNLDSRPQVMNTIALDVRPSIFQATHYPSFLLQGVITEGKKPVPGPPIAESDFLKSFLDKRLPHVFSVAVGDSGTGKSHLIRWMYHQIIDVQKETNAPWHIVLVPRSSSNLADMIRHIIKGFQGEIVERIQDGLSQLHSITLEGAKARVLDQLAFVLDPKNRRDLAKESEISEEKELVQSLLPALLHDSAIRRLLADQEEGIITRLARHVYGERDKVEEDPPDLKWKSEDLEFDPLVCDRAGEEARELATTLMNDPEFRSIATKCLNGALRDTLSFLLGLRYGDLLNVMQEIRKELLSKKQELILLIEDMSVTMGLDADLVEALQVRTKDTGEELCKMRSIVGVTHDDFERLRENIRGRIDQVAFFNLGFNEENQGASDGNVKKEQIIDFVSRYLNASRYSIEDLDQWHKEQPVGAALPSYCEKVQCPNMGECHDTFGQIDGKGLYPLSPEAVVRLYRNITESSISTDRSQAFNPRLMVSRVLNAFLFEGEQSIEQNRFPSTRIGQTFSLREIGASAQNTLRSKFPSYADRLRVALEVYSPAPNDLKLLRSISMAFDLPFLDEAYEIKKPSPADDTTQEDAKPDESKGTSVVAGSDEFDRWLNEKKISDSDLNRWRGVVHSAISSSINWDTERLASVKSKFLAKRINFEGQRTKGGTGDVTITIGPSPEAALALRGLSKQFESPTDSESEEWLLCASQCIQQWTEEIRNQLRRLIDVPGNPSPVSLAAQLLAFGSLIRNLLKPNMTEVEVLAQAMTPWPKNEPAGRSAPWRALWKAYQKKAENVRRKLIDTLVCSKGASIRESSMIDPSAILSALRHVQTHGVPESLPAETESWGEFQEVFELGKEIHKHIDQIQIEEKEACKIFINQITPLFDPPVDANLSETFKSIGAVFQKANDEALLTGRDALALSNQLQHMNLRDFKSCIRKAEQAVKTEKTRELMGALSGINRELMEQSSILIQNIERVMEASTLKARDRVKELGGDDESLDSLKNEIQELLSNLKADLEVFQTGGGNA